MLLVFGATHSLVRCLPGDPLETLSGELGLSASSQQLTEELGLDRTWHQALTQDFSRALRGDWGTSLIHKKPVITLVKEHFSKTLLLVLASLLLGLSLSLGLAALAVSAVPRVSPWANSACDFLGILSAALPVAWFGPLLMYLLAVQLPLFPVSGHVMIPALTLGLSFSGLWSRLLRNRLQEALALGSARGARARGLGELRILWKHALIPSSGFLLAYLASQAGAFLSGAFFTEVLFDWPGMGSLLVRAVHGRDYPLIQAAVFVGATTSLLGSFLGDGIQTLIDPRIREKGAER